MEPEGSLSCSEQPATGLYLRQIHYHKAIIIEITGLFLGTTFTAHATTCCVLDIATDICTLTRFVIFKTQEMFVEYCYAHYLSQYQIILTSLLQDREVSWYVSVIRSGT